jgi:hypothetical protein
MNLKIKLTLMLLLIFNISLPQDGYKLSGKVSDEGKIAHSWSQCKYSQTTRCGNGFRRNFQLEVKRGDVLQFSYLGYVKKSITITNQKTLNVVMV